MPAVAYTVHREIFPSLNSFLWWGDIEPVSRTVSRDAVSCLWLVGVTFKWYCRIAAFVPSGLWPSSSDPCFRFVFFTVLHFMIPSESVLQILPWLRFLWLKFNDDGIEVRLFTINKFNNRNAHNWIIFYITLFGQKHFGLITEVSIKLIVAKISNPGRF